MITSSWNPTGCNYFTDTNYTTGKIFLLSCFIPSISLNELENSEIIEKFVKQLTGANITKHLYCDSPE